MSADFPTNSSARWDQGIAPPGASFWESISRIATPVFGYYQNVTQSPTAYNTTGILFGSTNRRVYIRKIVVTTDADSDSLLQIAQTGNAEPSSIVGGHQLFWRRSTPAGSQGGDSAASPTTVTFPFFTKEGVPVVLKFDGEFFIDPGVALAFGCRGRVPNPNPNSVASPSPSVNLFAYGFEVDLDAY